jgi:hypothetical protein
VLNYLEKLKVKTWTYLVKEREAWYDSAEGQNPQRVVMAAGGGGGGGRGGRGGARGKGGGEGG